MGRYKDLDIKFNNLDKESKELLDKYKNEHTYKDNIKIPLNIYILNSDKYICLIDSNSPVHVWAWSDFKDETKGKVLTYENSQNIVLNKLMEFHNIPEEEILSKYSLRIKKVINN